MAQPKINYCCSNCGYKTIRWVGCCPECNEWNSIVAEQQQPRTIQARTATLATTAQLVGIHDIVMTSNERMKSGIKEWDNVLGGGILPGSFLILTGDPGIGKSTLLLQVADTIARKHKTYYFSSEESLQQVKGRALRLGIAGDHLLFSDQSSLEAIIAITLQNKPALLILDSIQNCYLASDTQTIPGTVGQLREAAFQLMKLAKENNIAVLITGHITKDGHMAGPKVLEHMVDGVFYLQAEDRFQTRILRSVKNRFGEVNEVGFFEMHEKGLVEISNINQQLLSEASNAPGSVFVCSMEGSRPLLLELQALCINSKFGMPQRVVTGLDPKRVVLIAAILEKYLHVKFSDQDIFVKVSGGFKIKESATDLGIALALLSSYFQKPLPTRSVAIAEMSLTGKITPTNQIGLCIKEAEKFGLHRIFAAKNQKVTSTCTINAFDNVYQLLALFPDEDATPKKRTAPQAAS